MAPIKVVRTGKEWRGALETTIRPMTPAEVVRTLEEWREALETIRPRRAQRRLFWREIAEIVRALEDEMGWKLESIAKTLQELFGMSRSQVFRIKAEYSSDYSLSNIDDPFWDCNLLALETSAISVSSRYKPGSTRHDQSPTGSDRRRRRRR
jgi:hypothetical protein